MKLENFNKSRKVLIIFTLIGAGVSIYLESSLFILLVVGFSMVLLTFLKTQVKNPIIDERLQDISEKAAQTSFKILLPILGITSLALFTAGDGPFYFFAFTRSNFRIRYLCRTRSIFGFLLLF